MGWRAEERWQRRARHAAARRPKGRARLSWNTTDESMRMAFEDGAGVPGSVLDSKVILDRETGRSRGFGFVTFSSPDLASAAIAKMNGMDVDGRQVRVDMASSRQR